MHNYMCTTNQNIPYACCRHKPCVCHFTCQVHVQCMLAEHMPCACPLMPMQCMPGACLMHCSAAVHATNVPATYNHSSRYALCICSCMAVACQKHARIMPNACQMQGRCMPGACQCSACMPVHCMPHGQSCTCMPGACMGHEGYICTPCACCKCKPGAC